MKNKKLSGNDMEYRFTLTFTVLGRPNIFNIVTIVEFNFKWTTIDSNLGDDGSKIINFDLRSIGIERVGARILYNIRGM